MTHVFLMSRYVYFHWEAVYTYLEAARYIWRPHFENKMYVKNVYFNCGDVHVYSYLAASLFPLNTVNSTRLYKPIIFEIFEILRLYKPVMGLWDFALVVVTYSEIVILPNNHIFKIKMRQIARILLTNNFKNENISLQLKLDQCLA